MRSAGTSDSRPSREPGFSVPCDPARNDSTPSPAPRSAPGAEPADVRPSQSAVHAARVARRGSDHGLVSPRDAAQRRRLRNCPDPEVLQRRGRAKARATAVVGGGVAAQHYDPSIKVNAVVRLDVTTLTGKDPRWVTSPDPPLRSAKMRGRSLVRVVHQSRRGRSMHGVKQSYGWS